MASMYPRTFPSYNKSSGERKVFDYFSNKAPTDWHIIHSFRLPGHAEVVFGEADFIVIAPNLGIFVLEIKSGGVGFDGSEWVFTDRYGNETRKHRGPFQQAREAMFELEKIIVNKLGDRFGRKNIVYGYGVIFTDTRDFPVNKITEDESWRLCQNSEHTDYCSFVRQLYNKFICELRNIHKNIPDPLNSESAKTIATNLRPIIECVVPLKSFIEQSERDIIELTEEQYDCLEDILLNDRIVIMGGAGTGKTLIAVEDAKRSSGVYYNVAVFCFNKNLADYIRLNVNIDNVKVASIHSYMSELCHGRIEENTFNDDYFFRKLPETACAVIKEKKIHFDKIIVDEFQDLCDSPYLRFFDTLLSGGLFDGKFSFYGDFAGQAIYNANASLTQLEQMTFFAKKYLTINCRNTKNIGNELINVTGYEAKQYRLKITGEKVDYISWTTQEEEVEKLRDLLKSLRKQGIDSKAIMILSPNKREKSVVDVYDKARYIIGNYGERPEDNLALFSTIQAFKGLESEIIILTDISDYSDRRLMYIALSRARSKLYVLEHVSAKKQRQKILIGR